MRRKLQLAAFIITVSLAVSSCQVDLKRVGDDVKNLGKAVADKIEDVDKSSSTPETEKSEETSAEETTAEETVATEPSVTETETKETEVAEITETTETTETTNENAVESVIQETKATENSVRETELPEETEIPTVTPIERVDFSDLTSIELTREINVENEAFREVYISEEDEIEYAQFEGNRSLVTIKDSPNVECAINLMADGFYQEAAGKYANVVANAKAQLELNPEGFEEFTAVYVSNDITTNGRILTVRMIYTVETDGNVTEKVEETYSFDVLTGKIIILDDIAVNSDELYEALLAEFKEDDEIDTFTPIFITPTDDYIPLRLVAVNKDGEETVIMVDLVQYSEYLNRFGKNVCLIP